MLLSHRRFCIETSKHHIFLLTVLVRKSIYFSLEDNFFVFFDFSCRNLSSFSFSSPSLPQQGNRKKEMIRASNSNSFHLNFSVRCTYGSKKMPQRILCSCSRFLIFSLSFGELLIEKCFQCL